MAFIHKKYFLQSMPHSDLLPVLGFSNTSSWSKETEADHPAFSVMGKKGCSSNKHLSESTISKETPRLLRFYTMLPTLIVPPPQLARKECGRFFFSLGLTIKKLALQCFMHASVMLK